MMCDILHCLYENFTKPEYDEFTENSLIFMLRLLNYYKDQDDFEEILRDIHEQEFFVFLSKIIETSISDEFNHLIHILKIYNTVFSINIDEPLVELYAEYSSTFNSAFELLNPDIDTDLAVQLIILLANVAYSNKKLAHELIDKGYYYVLIEMLKNKDDNSGEIIYAFHRALLMTDYDYSRKLLNYDAELIYVLFDVLKRNVTNEECSMILKIIDHMLNVNEDDEKFIKEIKSNEAYLNLSETNFKKPIIDTIENPN